MQSGVEQRVRLGNSFLHEDVCQLRGAGGFRFAAFCLCLSSSVVSIKNYNIKASKGANNPVEALVSAPSENTLSWVLPEG